MLSGKKAHQLELFVSIGAGLNQIPLIVEAKKIGFQVIGVDKNTSAPGFFKCDLKIQESIENYITIYKKLRELLVDGDIHGIMTKSYGNAIRTTSYLTEKFNIPFLPFKSSDLFINKRKMKSIFKSCKILTPVYKQVIPQKLDNVAKDRFPAIIKPAVGHAKINVSFLKNCTEMKQFIDKQGNGTEKFILEKFVEGDEIITIGIIYKGEYFLADITDKITSFPPYFTDIMHISPSQYYYLSERIQDIGQTVAESFSIDTSPLIMEFVVTQDKELYLIEAVPEFGGEFLPDILVPARTGYNLINQAIRALTGREFKPPKKILKKNSVSVVVKYITGEKGILASCNPEGPVKSKGTIFSRIFKEIGSNIQEPVTNLDRIGVVVVRGKTIDETIKLADRAADKFNIRIK